MINSRRKNLLFISVLLITMLVGISMVSATNSTNSTKMSNDTVMTSTTHNVISTSQVNNTVNEKIQTVTTNKTVKNQNNETKTLKKDATGINTWQELVSNIKSTGTYTLNNNLIANTTLNTSSGTNAVINGNGHTITFTKDGLINVTITSTLTIANITLDGNNTARDNSGIINNGTLTLENSTMKNFHNPAFYATYCSGAIYNTGVNSNFTNNNFTNNTASTQDGGAIYNNGTNCTFNGNNFINNSAYCGGAIENSGTNCIFINNNFTYNNATTGGVIYNYRTTNCNFTNNNFTNNTSGDGGAIDSYDCENCNFINNNFTNNTASSAGGAINNKANTNFIFKNNNFTQNSAQDGGAIFNNGAKCTFTENDFTENKADYNGGAIYNNDVNTNFTNNNFTDNNATQYGSAIYHNNNKNCLYTNNTFMILTWNELVGYMQCEDKYLYNTENTKNNTYILLDNLEATSTLTDSNPTNNTINGNGHTITFTKDGLINIKTASTLTIANITLDGNNIERQISGITNNGTLTVQNSTLKNFNNTATSSEYWGGVIHNTGENCNFTENNFTKNNAEYGGAIYNNDGKNCTITNNNFTENTAQNGGAIYNSGTNCNFTGNNFTENKAIENGGAIYNKYSENSTITNNNFTENTATEGGAIFNNDGENCTIKANNFTENKATNGGAIENSCRNCTITENNFTKNNAQDGGAIENNCRNCTIIDNNFSENKATRDGGAIYNDENANNCTFTSNNFTENNATRNGGAIYNYNGKNCIITNSNFTENKATEGGAIDNLEGENCTITNSRFIGNNATEGGAIYNYGDANCKFLENNFTSNNAKYGGAIDNYHATNCNFNGNNFIENIATQDGGAIENSGSNSNFNGNNFTNNKAEINGGAIDNYDDANCNFTNNNFTNNNAEYGGAIKNSGENYNFTENNFTDNNATEGGAIDNSGTNCNFTSNNFIGNNATRNGGAIYNYDGTNCTFTKNNFINNTAMEYGGAIKNSGENCTVINNNFTQNNATEGGAIDNYDNENCTFTKNNFINNTAMEYGGAIYNEDGENCTVINNNFTGNNATEGGAIYNYDANNCSFIGNNFTNNTASSGETLNITGIDNVIANNTYFNTIIQFTNKNITCTVVGDNILVTANITLANPSYYDSNILDKTIYSIYRDNVLNKTQEGISTFDVTSFEKPCKVYEILSIAQSMDGNYKTNEITIKQTTNTTIVAKNIAYNDTLKVNGTASNLTSGTLNVTIKSGEEVILSNDSVIINNQGQWNTTFTDILNIGSYTVTVTYNDTTGNYTNFENSTTFNVTKQVTNTTIVAKDIIYGDNLIINGTVTNIPDNTVLNITVGSEKTNVTVNSSKWNTTITGLAIGNYTINVTYEGDTTHESFTNTTKVNVSNKFKTNSTIIVRDIIYGNDLIINGTVTNIPDNTVLNVTVGDIKTNVTVIRSEWNTTITGLAAGNYTVNVTYKGDTIHEAFTNTTNVTVNKKSINTTIVANDIVYNEILKVNGTVTNITIGSKLNVTITNTNSIIDSIVVNTTEGGNWNATFPDKLNVGLYNVTVTYNGTIGNYTSFENSTTFKVTRLVTNTTIVTKDIIYGNNLVINGTVTNIPDNTVLNITVGNKNTNVTVNNSKWNTTITGLAAGNYTVNVTYKGDTTHEAFTNTTNITVNKKSTNTTIVVNNIKYSEILKVNGTAYNLTSGSKLNVTITNTSGIVDSKIVNTTEGGNWNTTFTDKLNVGSYTVIVTYNGSIGNYTSFENSTTFKVIKQVTNTTIVTEDIIYGNDLIINGTVTNIPDNTVLNITVGNKNTNVTVKNAKWNTTITGLVAGNYTVNVAYNGDTTHEAFTNTTNITVSKKSTNTTIIANSITYNEILKVNGTTTNVTIGSKLNVTITNTSSIVDSKIVNTTNGGKWNTTFTQLPAGSYTLTVTYKDTTGNYENFTNTTTFNVGKKSANTTINAGNIVYSNTETIKGIVDNTQVKSLNVSLNGKTNSVKVDNNGSWSITFNGLSVGVYNVTVSYTSTTGNYSDFKNTTTFKVSKIGTNSTIITSSIVFTEVLKVSGKVSNITNGTLIVKVGNKSQNVKINSNGSWNTTFKGLTAATYTVNVIYNGDTNHKVFTNTTKVVVNKIATKISINAVNTLTGKITKLNATIIDAKGNPVTSGTVTFTNQDGKILLIAKVTKGIATANTIIKKEMTGKIIAKYTGESYKQSTANNTLIVKTKYTTKMTIDKVNTLVGDKVNLTVRLTDEYGKQINGGKIVFKINGKTLRDQKGNVIYVRVTNGVATVEYMVPSSWAKSGTTISAVYSGTSYYTEYRTTQQKINITKKTAKLEMQPITAKAGQKITLKVKITDNNKTVKTGRVVFKINGKTIKDNNGKTIYATVTNGIAKITYTIPTNYTPKKYTITSVYADDAYNRAQTNTTLTIKQ